MSSASVRIIRTVSDWFAIEDDLERVRRKLDDTTELQSHRFLSHWWRHLGEDDSLFIVLIEFGGEPAGYLPLQRRSLNIWGKHYRLLEFIGMPDELDRPALILPANREEALDLALKKLLEIRDEWDLLRLEEIVLDKSDRRILCDFAQRSGMLLRFLPFHPCPVLDLGQPWDTYFAGLSRKTRKNVRNMRNKLEREGALRLTTHTKPSDIATALDTYLNVESRSWKPAENIGVGKSNHCRNFYRSLLEDYATSDQARILVLSLDRRPIAATISIQSEGVYYSLQITHDEQFSSYSPGTVLESMELEGLMREQTYRRYEFLGGALANKRRWADTEIATEQLMLHQRDVRMLAFDWLYFRIKPRFKAVLRTLRLMPGRRDG